MRRRGTKWDCVLTRESAGLRSFIFFPAARSLALSFSCVHCVYASFVLCLRRSRSLSVPSDTNCLLPNLIRNFRRRGNLTSFLFSLARSYACSFVRSGAAFLSQRASCRALVPRIFLSAVGPAKPTNQFIWLPRYHHYAPRLFTTSSRCPACSRLRRAERYLKRGAWKKAHAGSVIRRKKRDDGRGGGKLVRQSSPSTGHVG